MQHYTPGSGPRLQPPSTGWSRWPILRPQTPQLQGHRAVSWPIRHALYPNTQQPPGFVPRIHLPNQLRLRNPGYNFRWGAYPQVTPLHLSHRQPSPLVGMGRDGGEDRWRGNQEERGVHRVPSAVLARDVVREKCEREPSTSVSCVKKEVDIKGAMMTKDKGSRTLHSDSSQHREKLVERNQEKDIKSSMKTVEGESKVKDSSKSRDSTSPQSSQNCVIQSKSTSSDPSASSSQGDNRDGSTCQLENSRTSVQLTSRDTASLNSTASATASESKRKSCSYHTVRDKNPVVVLERLPESDLRKYMKRSVSPAESCPESGSSDDIPAISERPHSAPSSSFPSSEVKASDIESLKDELSGVGKSVSEKLGAHGAFEIDPRVKNLSRPLQRACSSGKNASELTFNVPKIHLSRWSSQSSNKTIFIVKHNDLDKLRTKLSLAKLGVRKPIAKSLSHPSKKKSSKVENSEEARVKMDTSGGSSSASRLSYGNRQKKKTIGMDSFQRYLDENQETLTSSDSSDQEEDVEGGQSERLFRRECTPSASDGHSQEVDHMTDRKTVMEKTSGESEERNPVLGGPNIDSDKDDSCPPPSGPGDSSSDEFESVHSSCSPPLDVQSKASPLPSSSVQSTFSRDVSPLAKRFSPVQTLSKHSDSSLTNEGAPYDCVPRSSTESTDSGMATFGNDVPDATNSKSAQPENLDLDAGNSAEISAEETSSAGQVEVPTESVKDKQVTVWKDKLLAAEFSPSSQPISVSESEGYQIDTDNLEVASFEEVCMKVVSPCEDISMSVEGDVSGSWLDRAISESKWNYGEAEAMSSLPSAVESGHSEGWNGEEENKEKTMPVLTKEILDWRKESCIAVGNSDGETLFTLPQDASLAESTEGFTMDHGDVSHQTKRLEENKASDATPVETGAPAPADLKDSAVSGDVLSENQESHLEAPTLSHEACPESKSDELKEVEVPQVSVTEEAETPEISSENLSLGRQVLDQLSDCLLEFTQDVMHPSSNVSSVKSAQVVVSSLSDCEDNSNHLVIDEGTECSQEGWETPSESSPNQKNISMGNDRLGPSHEHTDQGKGPADRVCKTVEDAPKPDLLPTANCLDTQHQPNGSRGLSSLGIVEEKDQSTPVSKLSSQDGPEKVSSMQSLKRTYNEDAVNSLSAPTPVAHVGAPEERPNEGKKTDHQASMQTVQPTHEVATAVPSSFQTTPSDCINSTPLVGPEMTSALVSTGIQQQAPLLPVNMTSMACVPPVMSQTPGMQQQTSHAGVVKLSAMQAPQSQGPPQLITTANCPLVLQVGNFLAPVCSGVLLTSSKPAQTVSAGMTEVTLVQSHTSQAGNSTSGIDSPANGLMHSGVVVHSKPGSNPGSFVPRVTAPVSFPVQLIPVMAPTLPSMPAWELRKERPILPAPARTGSSSGAPASAYGATGCNDEDGAKVGVGKSSDGPEPSCGEDSELGLVITSVRGGVDAEAAVLEVDAMPQCSSEGGPFKGSHGGTSLGSNVIQSTATGPSVGLQVASSTHETQSSSAPVMTPEAAACQPWAVVRSTCSSIGPPPPLVRLGETSLSSGQPSTSGSSSVPHGREAGTGALDATRHLVQAPTSLAYDYPENKANVPSSSLSEKDKRNSSGMQQRAEIMSPPGTYNYVLPEYLQEQVASIVNMSPSHCTLQNNLGGLGSPHPLTEPPLLDGLLNAGREPCEEQDMSAGATTTLETQDFSAFNLSPTNKIPVWAAAPVEPRDHLRLPVRIAPNAASAASEKTAQMQQLQSASNKGKSTMIEEDHVAVAHQGEGLEQNANIQDSAVDSQEDSTEKQDQPTAGASWTMSESSPIFPSTEQASSGDNVEFPIEVDIAATTPGGEMNSSDSYETDSTMTYSCDEDALVKQSSSPPVIRCYRKSDAPPHADDLNQNSIAPKSAQQKEGLALEGSEDTSSGKKTAVKGKSRKSATRKQGRRLKRKNDDPSARVQFRILKQNAEGAAATASEGIVLRKLNRRSCRENKVVVTNAMMVQSENGMLGTVFSSDEEITDPESPPPAEEPREFTQESVMRELGLTKCSDAGSAKVKGSGSHSSDSSGRKIRASTRSQRRQWAPKESERGSREKRKSPTDGASEDTASPPLEDLDSEELPRIHPPKRRRCSQGKSGHGGLTRSGGLNMQDAVPGPAQGGSGSSERIMREFPRHNWLEQKIQQLSSGPHVAAQVESASPASTSTTRKMPARDMTGSLDEPSPPPPPGKKSVGSGERLNQKAIVVSGKKQPEGTQQVPGELESNDYKNKLRRRYPLPEQTTNSPFAECAPSSLEREDKEKMASSVACDSDKSLREDQSCRKPSPTKDCMNVDDKTWHVAKKAKKDTAVMSPPEDGKSCISEAGDPGDAQLQREQVSDIPVEMETDHETCAPESVTGDWETPVDSKSTSQPSSKGTLDGQPGSVDHNRDIHGPESAPTAASLSRQTTGVEGGTGVGDRDMGNPKASRVETASGSKSVPGASNPSSALMVGSEESQEASRKDPLSTQAKTAREGQPGATDEDPEPRNELDAPQDAAPLDLCTKKQHSVLPSPRTRAHPPPVQLVHPQVQQPVSAAPSVPSPNTLILQTKLALSNVQVVPETPGPQRVLADPVQTSRTEDADSVPLSLTVRGAGERKDETSSAGRSRSLTGVEGLSGRPADSELREGPVLDAAMIGTVLPERTESIPHLVSKPTPIGGDWQNQATLGAHMQHSVDAPAASNPSAMETSVAAAEDLDPEYERELRELRELEELAARKEKEREEVLSMRKRKAEMIRSMEEQRKRMKLSAVPGGTSQQTTSATPQAMNTSTASPTSTNVVSVSGPEALNADARLSSLALTASWTTSSGSVAPAAQTSSTTTVSSGGTALAASSQLPLGVPSMRLPVSIAVHPSYNVPASKSGSVTAGTTSVSTSVGVPSITMRSGAESTTLVPSSSAGQGPHPSAASDNQSSNVPTLPAPLSTLVSWNSSAAVASATAALSSIASSQFDAKVTTLTSCRASASVSTVDGTKSLVAQGGISQLPNTQGETVGATAVGLSGPKAAATAADSWRPMVHMINKAIHEKARQSEQCAMEETRPETNKDMPNRSRNNSTSGSAEVKTSDADRIGPPATAHQHQSSVSTKVHLEPVPPFIKNSCPYLARSNPLEEPPAPLSHKSSPNPGSLQPAHSQRPFQLAGYLIMPASSASSTSALTPGTCISTVSSDSAASQLKTSISSHQDSLDGKVSASSAVSQLAGPPALVEQARKAPLARGLKRPPLPVQSTSVLPPRMPGAGGPPQLAPIMPRSAQPHYGQPTTDPRAWTSDKAAMQYQRAPLPETIDLTVESSEMHATAGWSAARSMGFVPPRTVDREAYVQQTLQTALAKRYSAEDPHHHSLRHKVGPADSLGHPDRARAAPPHVITSSKESAFQPVVPANTVPVRLVQDNTIVMVAPGKKSHPDRTSFEVAGLPEIYQSRSGEMMPVVPGGSGSSGLSHHSGQYPMQHHAMMNPMMQSSHVREEAKQLQQQQQHGSSSGYPSHAMYHQSRQVAMQYPSGRHQPGAYPSDQDRRYATAQASSEIHPPQQADLTPQGHQQYYASSRGPQPTSHHIVSMETMGHSSWPQGYPPHGAPSASMVPQASAVSHSGASPAQEHGSSLSHSQRDVLIQRQIQQQQLYQQQYLQQQQQQQQRRHSPLYPSRSGSAQLSSSSAHQGSLASRAQPYPGLHSRPHPSQQLPPSQHEVALMSRMQTLHPSVQGYPQPPAAATKPDVPSLVQHNKQVAATRPAAAPVPPKASGLPPVNGSCAVCRNLAIYLCSNCRKVWYCSGECQTAHWRVHAADCKELV